MSYIYKPDGELFKQHLRNVKQSRYKNLFWCDYFFHFTGIKNVVKILTEEVLFCREYIEKNEREFQDTASHDVLSWTPPQWKKYVRLYFRPKTPMLYQVEGLRPSSKIQYNAECPVPVFLLFDASEVISWRDTQFSNGNLAKQTPSLKVSSTIEDFCKLPFDDIYHNDPYSREQKDHYNFHRQAEIIFPQQMDLSTLKIIWCRSESEYDTLRNLLPDSVWDKWRNQVTFSNPESVFFKQWLHIQRVNLSHDTIYIKFNPATPKQQTNEKLKLKIQVHDTLSDEKYSHELNISDNIKEEKFSISTPLNSYDVHMWINDHMVYYGQYLLNSIDDIPF
ncbi:MAG: DUF4433 domain-containing protein [Anaerolineae bacterium]|jgi:hypothetical protein|nr:DUF4433 domain-containing protein [Anaerolineae bacterium]